MPARPDFEPILPKGPITNVKLPRIYAALRDFAARAHSRLATYPVQTPSAAVHYRRTGKLGQGWTTRGPQMRGTELEVIIGNAIEYAEHVQGFKTHPPLQVRWAAPYGWISVEEVAKQEWAIARPMVERALEGR
ncbi:MAG TPA: hypothetical protein VI729_08125 [Anaerolineales bacterium]|nr:hypothetical protein [Anaerolineales bacterium]